jgi:hypothetical protein
MTRIPFEDFRGRYNLANLDEFAVREGFGTGATEADGTVVIEFDFRTGASHTQPESRAHLSFYWVYVRANGFGGVFVPVRHNPLPTAVLKQKELFVPIGLTPVK